MVKRRSQLIGGAVVMVVLATMLCSCESMPGMTGGKKGSVTVAPFDTTSNGQQVDKYTLVNANGMTAEIITYGGIMVSLTAPDREGNMEDILLGADSVQGYVRAASYFGGLIGRYGNRIGGARFTLDGVEYKLPANDGANSLHGGTRGFDKVIWKAEPVESSKGVGVKLTYLSPDGDQGYPGNLEATVVYTLTNENEVRIDYTATTDKPTVVNLTQHNYYNLTGCKRDILGHELMMNADRYTPVDSGLIPTGELEPVADTPMDFTEPTAIGAHIDAGTQQLGYGQGYDHNWVLNRDSKGLMEAATVYEPESGRVMTVWTTEPGLQFYSGNFLNGTFTGKNGIVYKHRYGLCLETQHYPDSPNQPNFPSTTLRPGQVYKTTTVYTFSAR